MSTESERIAALEKGFKDAQAAAEANFDPMKGRTYIARMSPAMKRMMVEAIKKARAKRAERKEAKAKSKKEQGFRDYLAEIKGRIERGEGKGEAPMEKITSSLPARQIDSTLPERNIAEGESRIEYNPSRRDKRRSERGKRKAREEQARYEAELDASLREDFPDLDLDPPRRKTLEESMRGYQRKLREEQEKNLLRDYNYGGKILKKYRR
tara:strand:+ start:1309 stop:1938 length:630 start_codon:yes stop_codon:yes gene_type:complete